MSEVSEVSGLGYGRVDSKWLKHSFFKDSGLAPNEILGNFRVCSVIFQYSLTQRHG